MEDDVIEHDEGSINDDPSTNENSKDMHIPQSIEIDINKVKSKKKKNLEAPKTIHINFTGDNVTISNDTNYVASPTAKQTNLTIPLFMLFTIVIGLFALEEGDEDNFLCCTLIWLVLAFVVILQSSSPSKPNSVEKNGSPQILFIYILVSFIFYFLMIDDLGEEGFFCCAFVWFVILVSVIIPAASKKKKDVVNLIQTNNSSTELVYSDPTKLVPPEQKAFSFIVGIVSFFGFLFGIVALIFASDWGDGSEAIGVFILIVPCFFTVLWLLNTKRVDGQAFMTGIGAALCVFLVLFMTEF